MVSGVTTNIPRFDVGGLKLKVVPANVDNITSAADRGYFPCNFLLAISVFLILYIP